jgi:hypothetical protein
VPGLTDVASAAQTTPIVDPDPPPAPGAEARPARRRPVLLVGDSVMLGASKALRRAIGRRAVIDARVARQFPEGADVVRSRLRRMAKDTMVVIHLGTNGYIKYSDIHELLEDVAKRRRVVLVTVRVPLEWQDSVNALLRSEAKRFKNVRIADWYGASGASGLVVDGAHTTQSGMRVYARTIAAQLR